MTKRMISTISNRCERTAGVDFEPRQPPHFELMFTLLAGGIAALYLLNDFNVPVVLVICGAGVGVDALSWLLRWRDYYFERCPHGSYVNRRSSRPCAACMKVRQQQEEEARQRCEREEFRRLERERKERELMRQAALRVRQLQHLKQMPPVQFEQFVLELYRRLGWKAEATAVTGDDGIDGRLSRDGQYGILQCKRLGTGKVGASVLRDLAGAVAMEKADFGVCVTTTGYTTQALQTQSNAENLILVDGEKLLSMVSEAFADVTELPAVFALTEADERAAIPDSCPKCGHATRVVRGRYGRFLGCSGYPNCRWAADLPQPAGQEMTQRHRKRRQ